MGARRYVVTLYEYTTHSSSKQVTREVVAYDAADALTQERLRCSHSTFGDGTPTARVMGVGPAEPAGDA